MIGLGVASAQIPERVTDMRGPPPATPLDWDWEKLSDGNVFWNFVTREGRPLVVILPGVPQGGGVIDDHLARFFYDQGYALGALTWRDERARRQPVSDSVSQITAQFEDVRANAGRRGGFDRNRIIVVAFGEAAFPASWVAFTGRNQIATADQRQSPICAAIFVDGMNFDTANPDSRMAKRKFAQEADSVRSLSPIVHAKEAPPTLLMTRRLDVIGAQRADAVAAAIRAGGGIAVRTTYARFEESDPATYLGHSENPSTAVIEQFLREHCPAEAGTTP